MDVQLRPLRNEPGEFVSLTPENPKPSGRFQPPPRFTGRKHGGKGDTLKGGERGASTGCSRPSPNWDQCHGLGGLVAAASGTRGLRPPRVGKPAPRHNLEAGNVDQGSGGAKLIAAMSQRARVTPTGSGLVIFPQSKLGASGWQWGELVSATSVPTGGVGRGRSPSSPSRPQSSAHSGANPCRGLLPAYASTVCPQPPEAGGQTKVVLPGAGSTPARCRSAGQTKPGQLRQGGKRCGSGTPVAPVVGAGRWKLVSTPHAPIPASVLLDLLFPSCSWTRLGCSLPCLSVAAPPRRYRRA